MRLVTLAAAIFFALEAHASETAILAFWYPNGVVVGADSRELTNVGPPRDLCKMAIVGNVAVAEAGWLHFRHQH